jgi:hypothetical protein
MRLPFGFFGEYINPPINRGNLGSRKRSIMRDKTRP